MTYDKLVKYLGVKFKPEGRISVPMEEWKMWLEKIGKSKWKQERKVEAVRCCIIPKMLHTLRLSNIYPTKLRKLTRTIRKWVKSTLHMAEWTTNAWIHLKNGCDIQDLEKLVTMLRKKVVLKMNDSGDVISKVVAGRMEDRRNRERQKFKA